MKICQAVVEADGRTVLERVPIAVSVWDRFRGLMLRKSLQPGEGLLLTHCSSVHTCFMRFPIDVVYLNRNQEVVKVVEGLKPYRASCCLGADSVLEAASGWARRAGARIGTRLNFPPITLEN